MSRRLFVLLMLVASLALVLAACTTDSDDDEVAAADDTVAEAADDATDDDDAAVEEEADDAIEEDADDSAEATDDAAVEDADDTAVEDADDAVTEDDDDAEAATDDATDDVALDDEEFEAVLAALGFEDESELEAPALDLETMSASTPGLTMEARAYNNVHVADITEELLVAVSMDSDYAGEADSISAYVCDGDQVGFYVTGHVENGQASVQLADNAYLEFTVDGDSISGSVTLDGQEIGSFDATEATGDAGLYVAEETIEGQDVVGRWIVLEDGRQAGQLCIGIRAWGVCIGVSHQ